MRFEEEGKEKHKNGMRKGRRIKQSFVRETETEREREREREGERSVVIPLGFNGSVSPTHFHSESVNCNKHLFFSLPEKKIITMQNNPKITNMNFDGLQT